MRVRFKLATANGLVECTVSEVTSYAVEGDCVTLRRARPALTEGNRPSLIRWTERYEHVTNFTGLADLPSRPGSNPLRLHLAEDAPPPDTLGRACPRCGRVQLYRLAGANDTACLCAAIGPLR